MAKRLLETKQSFKHPQWYFQKRSYHVRIRTEVVTEFLKDSTFERMLDVGCGDGSISLPLLTSARHLTLLDMSEAMLALARERISPELKTRVKIINNDFMGADLESASYDLIICLGVLAYVDDLELFLRKLDSLLKPGGSVIIEWTDGHHPMSWLGRPYYKLKERLSRQKPEFCLPRSAEIIEGFRNLGFTTAGSYRYCSPLPLVRRVLGPELNYRVIRMVHGKAGGNRAAGLGEECIFHFRKMPANAATP